MYLQPDQVPDLQQAIDTYRDASKQSKLKEFVMSPYDGWYAKKEDFPGGLLELLVNVPRTAQPGTTHGSDYSDIVPYLNAAALDKTKPWIYAIPTPEYLGYYID